MKRLFFVGMVIGALFSFALASPITPKPMQSQTQLERWFEIPKFHSVEIKTESIAVATVQNETIAAVIVAALGIVFIAATVQALPTLRRARANLRMRDPMSPTLEYPPYLTHQ